jgi:hypothetical protein
LKSIPKARADWPALMSAALIGSGVGLGLGATYLAAGMSRHAADHARGLQMAEAAAGGYAGSYLADQGRGLRAGYDLYGLRPAADAPEAAAPFTGHRSAAKVKRQSELQCLTAAVYYEARGEGPRGQAAVAQVVMNRVRHPAFPATVCGVVFQGAGHRGCQFSFACDGSMAQAREAAAWERARRVAARALAGVVMGEVGSATHFHTAAVNPVWGPQMLRVATVGVHVFYKFAPHRLRLQPTAQPQIQQAVLTSAPVGAVADLRVAPRIELAIATSLQPVSTAEAAPAAVAKPATGTKAAAAAPAPAEAAPRPKTESAASKAKPTPVAAQPAAKPVQPATTARSTEAMQVKTLPPAGGAAAAPASAQAG